ncbi:alpha/beta fold hydrolase [Rhodococcus sp. Q]|uniref:alpha/beta fold hydrolase n=1 Tax=Rhodococcus sp. Q TaxID=2502252 RepID=UPI0010F777B2|nr:alpha/beta fold hydrolase [Rhodococcus sp. Q]
MRVRRPRRLAAAVVAATVAVVAVGVGTTLSGSSEDTGIVTQDLTLPVPESPGTDARVQIDARLHLPQRTPAPAVLLAHGFGGSKDTLEAQANTLAADGFVVLAYSARGFGSSTGTISLNDPDREIADARALVDWLADRPEVTLDAEGDPRVGVTGASYGGALSLMLAGTDPRVDAVAAAITWNDLGQALFPNYGAAPPAPTPAAAGYSGPGVLKRGWAGIFFGAGVSGADTAGTDSGPCGRFDPAICLAYAPAAETGTPTPELLDLLRSHSPVSVADRITAPTLLLQGEQDTLFGLDQADATARQIAAAGTPVRMRWFPAGHDSGGDSDGSRSAAARFLTEQLHSEQLPSAAGGPDQSTPFVFTVPGATGSDNPSYRRRTAPDYPGLTPTSGATPQERLTLSGPPQTVDRPPGATPAAISSVPGLGAAANLIGAAGVATDLVSDPPGQTARFATEPLRDALTITGTSTVSLTVTTTAATGDAVLYAKLYDVTPQGRHLLPGGAVSAVRLADTLPGQSIPLTVSLPAVAYQVAEGHHLELAVTTTDQAYATPLTPARFTIALADTTLAVPSVDATSSTRALPLAPLVGIGALAVAVAALIGIGVLRSRRRAVVDADPNLVDTPLVVTGLRKSYDNGFRAVDGVDFTVRRGEVMGLLGPNGAGKTTTLRMLMGLITPTDGEIRVFGHRVTPGAPVLSRLGSFVEGSGLLPHLSGLDNLRLYWQSTGRPTAESRMDDALAIADLGDAVHRKVRSYSQGMRQRLALAQAMLGLPDLLVLDEPTNGLDPPQIATMRKVLVDYARDGRTVLVSSHLLAEVEQTCTAVVVMNHGRVIASGTVEEFTSAQGTTDVRVDDAAAAETALNDAAGMAVHRLDDEHIRVDLGDTDPAEMVRVLVEAGVAVRQVARTTRLEEVFLRLVHTADHRESATDREGEVP